MIYKGKAITVKDIGDGIAELNFDLQGESVNKFNALTLEELGKAAEKLAKEKKIKGCVVTSGKPVFIVGADITEFTDLFALPEKDLIGWVEKANLVFNQVEDLPFPTVTAINGIALGGGFEMCLSTDYRVMSSRAKVGLPEVKLGLFPGFGGTVRLPRVIGADNAIEWICAGKEHRPDAALKVGAVDAVVEPDKLMDAAKKMLAQCIEGKLDWKEKRQEKLVKLNLNQMESMMTFETSKAFVAGQAGPNYPAPVTAIKAMQKHATMDREKALAVEAENFVKMAKTPVSASLIGLFLNDQELKHKAKKLQPKAREVKQAAVLGAGIMGGGIAYQSAYKGTSILMKDIAEPALQLGLTEATKLLDKLASKGRIDNRKLAETLAMIRPTLSYGDFGTVDLVVEAVVENPKVKKAVLAELEDQVGEDTILTSNTSTISITHLAEDLKRPENFCGMHFFNPVHMMPLVEVIRGEKSSEEAIATTVAYATAMGKNPIVVNDCPGFLVNRILFPYFAGFNLLLNHGADFPRIDKLMERFGWPMGPAYLLDVVGIDTAHHAREVMAEGFPDRMKDPNRNALDVMYEAERYGQKNKKGFYVYEEDKRGKPKKVLDDSVYGMIKPVIVEERELTDEQIIERMMVPLCIETVRCLEDNIVDDPSEADMGLIYGIGFPPFRGGALRYIDSFGMEEFCRIADQYADLGPLYHPTDKMRDMAKKGDKYFG